MEAMTTANQIPVIRYSVRQKNLYRGTKTYYAGIYEEGEPFYEFSLKTTNEEEAKQWVLKQEKIYDLYKLDPSLVSEPLRRSNHKQQSKQLLLVQNSIDAYINHCINIRHLRPGSIETYNRLFRSLTKYCKANNITRIQQITANDAEAHIIGETWSPASQKLAINLFNNWFEYCKNIYTLNKTNPWSMLSRPKVDPKDKTIWSHDQMDKIIENAPNQEQKTYWAILRHCGSRNTETAALEWTDWNREAGTIRIKADVAKGRYERFVFVTEQLRPYLDAWYDACEDHSGKIFHHLGADESHRNRVFMKVLKKLDYKGHLHCWRDSWITHALESGMDAYTVAKLAGHKDPSTTLKWYARLSSDHMKNAANNIVS